jgi:hypothetical protein
VSRRCAADDDKKTRFFYIVSYRLLDRPISSFAGRRTQATATDRTAAARNARAPPHGRAAARGSVRDLRCTNSKEPHPPHGKRRTHGPDPKPIAAEPNRDPPGSCPPHRTFQEHSQARICRRGLRTGAPLLPLSRGARLNRAAVAPYLSRAPSPCARPRPAPQ